MSDYFDNWTVFNLEPSSARLRVNALPALKRIGTTLLAALVGGLAWLLWLLQPWMPPDRAVHISTLGLGSYEFQVWQRKNPTLVEPFATGLFVRLSTNEWGAFLLDFEDMYSPRVSLRAKDMGIVVYLRGKELGLLDQRAETFTRGSDGAVFRAALIGSEPPGNWWLGH